MFKPKTLLTAILVCLFVTLASCSSSGIKLSPEESHAFCEEYTEKIDWIKHASSADISFQEPFSQLIPRYKKTNTPLCLFEIVSVEPTEAESNSRIHLTILVHKVYSGDSSSEGKKIQGYASQTITKEASQLIGCQYIGYLNWKDESRCLFYPYWTFFVTDDNRLVSGYGCQLEESQIDQMTEYNFSLESRSYTGQTLDYFISKVREAEANVQAESQKNSL